MLTQVQQEYRDQLRNQIDQKRDAQKIERTQAAKDSIDREMYNQARGGQDDNRSEKQKKADYFAALQNQQRETREVRGNDARVLENSGKRGVGGAQAANQSPSYNSPPAYGNEHFDYKSPAHDDHYNPSHHDEPYPSNYGNDHPTRDYPADADTYHRDYPQSNPTSNYDAPPYSYGGHNDPAPYSSHQQPTNDLPTQERVQKNYLPNNPLSFASPTSKPGGRGEFRAHQEIKHSDQGIDRPNKPMVAGAGSTKDAYDNIRKKYGNHSASYNILTGGS